MVKVINISVTIIYNCSCGSWLKHWEKFSFKKNPCCAVNGCNTLASLGAHIQKLGSDDETVYIVPVCYQHNGNNSKLEISEDCKLVLANKNLTCERW